MRIRAFIQKFIQQVDEFMNPSMQKNGGFTVRKNEMLTLESEKPVSLNLLLQGKLDVYITPSHKKLPQDYEDLKYNSFRLFDLG